MSTSYDQSCEHCPDGHESPYRRPWSAFVSMERDSDGQPTHVYVAPSAGQHVSETDAEWVAAVLRAEHGIPCVGLFTEAQEVEGWCFHPGFHHRAATGEPPL